LEVPGARAIRFRQIKPVLAAAKHFAASPAVSEREQETNMSTARRVLIVDDDEDLRETLKDQLILHDEFEVQNQIAVWAYFADGKASGDTNTQVTLGTAYRNTSFIIYEATVQSLSGGLNEPSTAVLESTVIEHEFGHILGLTNFGAPMQTPHEDTSNSKHCNVESCLMYYAATTGNNLMNLGGTIPQLDALCIADLQANGGK
jgi:hypothetical protein